jgi:hypothetical protein
MYIIFMVSDLDIRFFAMDKSNGRAQIIQGRLFYSPNCTRTLDVIPPPPRDEHGEKNIFLPNTSSTSYRWNFFDLDIADYRLPYWWCLTFGWISFFPLLPYMYGPLFEILAIPPDHTFVFHKDTQSYSMPEIPMKHWRRLEDDLTNAVYMIRSRYHLTLMYPLGPSIFGYTKKHSRPGGLHMAMRKTRDWFVVWMALLSYVIAQGESLALQHPNSNSEGKEWYHILLEHFDPQWLEALQSSVVCSFSKHTERAGVFLEVTNTNVQMQPDVEWFCSCRVPVWYPWDAKLEKNPKFSYLGPLTTNCRLPQPRLQKCQHHYEFLKRSRSLLQRGCIFFFGQKRK